MTNWSTQAPPKTDFLLVFSLGLFFALRVTEKSSYVSATSNFLSQFNIYIYMETLFFPFKCNEWIIFLIYIWNYSWWTSSILKSISVGRHLKDILTLPKHYNGSNLATCRIHFILLSPCSLLKLSTGSRSSLTTKPLELLVFWGCIEWDFLMYLLRFWQLGRWLENSWCWALGSGSCFLFIILWSDVGSF